MKQAETVEMVRTLLGVGEDQDELIRLYLMLAQTAILQRAFPFQNKVTCVPDRYIPVQINIAVYLYNKRGAEGQIQHAENGISRSYASADIPKEMLWSVTPTVSVVTV